VFIAVQRGELGIAAHTRSRGRVQPRRAPSSLIAASACRAAASASGRRRPPRARAGRQAATLTETVRVSDDNGITVSRDLAVDSASRDRRRFNVSCRLVV